MQIERIHPKAVKVASSSHKAGIKQYERMYVYILILSNGSYYTGMTNNLKNRLQQHNEGKSISTRNYLPARLIYYTTIIGRSNARQLEVKIKNRGAGRYLRLKSTVKSIKGN